MDLLINEEDIQIWVDEAVRIVVYSDDIFIFVGERVMHISRARNNKPCGNH